MRHGRYFLVVSPAALMLLSGMLQIRADEDRNAYVQTNLVSDVMGMAPRTDSKLINSWGIDRSPSGPWWVNAAGTGLSLVFDRTGAGFPSANPLVVTIPSASGTGHSLPTGIVFNPTSDFKIGGQPATFLFASIDGTISGWNSLDMTHAKIMVNNPGSAYLGITMAQSGGINRLYAANFAKGKVEVYDADFKPAALSSDAFQDSTIPAGFSPFNVQNIGGSIYVTYAMPSPTEHEARGPGLGYVNEFTADGKLVRALAHGDWMNAPWGVVLAPPGFGELSMRLLVGQFGSGQIAAFEFESGKFAGMMRGQDGKPITIDGLWGLKFGNGGTAGPSTVLFFAAGIGDELHGLFGTLSPGRLRDDVDTEDDSHRSNNQ